MKTDMINGELVLFRSSLVLEAVASSCKRREICKCVLRSMETDDEVINCLEWHNLVLVRDIFLEYQLQKGNSKTL